MGTCVYVCVRVCMCVYEWRGGDDAVSRVRWTSGFVCVRVCTCVYVCVRVAGRGRYCAQGGMNVCVYVCESVCTRLCACVYVCVRVAGRGR